MRTPVSLLAVLVLLIAPRVFGLVTKKGFGAAAPPKSTPDHSICPCGSALEYIACCQPLHNGQCAGASPETITRARYSAYAKGRPEFLIDSAHPAHKDYARFAASGNRDPRKARRQMEKELVTKNSEVYEFLRLNILNSTLADPESNESKVTFQVLVRKRSDGSYHPYQVWPAHLS